MKTISVIGTGNMGKGIAKIFAEQGYPVMLGSREASRAVQTAAEINASIKGVNHVEAARGGDIIILAIPFQSDNPLLNELKSELKGKIVIDISNPLNSEYNGLTTAPDTSALEIIAGCLPESKVVGAFKNTLAGVLYNPLFDGKTKSSVLVAGSDEEAKAEVIKLINTLPFDALDAGGLGSARTIENMTVLVLGLSMKYELNWHAGFRILR